MSEMFGFIAFWMIIFLIPIGAKVLACIIAGWLNERNNK